jgi:hypothetical protein
MRSFFFPSHVHISLSCWGVYESNNNQKKRSPQEITKARQGHEKKIISKTETTENPRMDTKVMNKVLFLVGQTSLAGSLTPLTQTVCISLSLRSEM